MKGKITVREGTVADSREFLRLLVGLARFERLEPPSQAARRRILSDIFGRRIAKLLLAFLGTKAVGYALYFYTYSSFLARPTLYVEDIFVAQKFRRSGVGISLLRRCAREASEHNCGRMEWSVLTWNRNAIRFYKAMGAKRLSEWSLFRLDSKGLRQLAGGSGRL